MKPDQQISLEQPGEFTLTLNKTKTNENQRQEQTRGLVGQVREAGEKLDLFDILARLFIVGASLALVGYVPATLVIVFFSKQAIALSVIFYVLLAIAGLLKLIEGPLTWRRRLVGAIVVCIVWVAFCGGLNYAG